MSWCGWIWPHGGGGSWNFFACSSLPISTINHEAPLIWGISKKRSKRTFIFHKPCKNYHPQMDKNIRYLWEVQGTVSESIKQYLWSQRKTRTRAAHRPEASPPPIMGYGNAAVLSGPSWGRRRRSVDSLKMTRSWPSTGSSHWLRIELTIIAGNWKRTTETEYSWNSFI